MKITYRNDPETGETIEVHTDEWWVSLGLWVRRLLRIR